MALTACGSSPEADLEPPESLSERELSSGRSADEQDGQDEPAAAPTPTSARPSPTAAPSPARAGRTIEVAFAGGEVSGDTGRVPVPLNETVTIVVTSDVADEVHLHGYDVSAPVAPGEPATLTFDATIPGVFELELHEVGEELLSVQVS
ncbi:conserved protein of unknown function [Blastococcus saxobsidens DD2]|uniref:EfeO-type cupredoxin-like domain-containing protein n=1 Tax=Blastococcus saxobsidens (strain DD2) TaxID=1146883 RepID=H6RRL3_BLASD|nr:conserved protein of unknown function [Blastococcus saxobsidens DD2]